MAQARDQQHRYGEHYTPLRVAELLAALGIRAATDTVFDPSCGDGRLLQAAHQCQIALRQPGSPTSLPCPQQLFGLDRSAAAVAAAQQTRASIRHVDFFDFDPQAPAGSAESWPQAFDVMIGNPPYIRQEFIEVTDKIRIRQCLARDARDLPETFWPRWSGRSDMYVYFFAHAIRFLKAHGRLVFLTASSWLDAAYGESLRQFLLNNFRIVAVIESVAESFFADASINTVITVLERETEAEARTANPVRFVKITQPLEQLFSHYPDEAAGLARALEEVPSSMICEGYALRVLPQSELANPTPQPSNWSLYLRADDVFFQILERGNTRLRRLAEVANVRFGVKTGANHFFYVQGASQQSSRREWLALKQLAKVRRGITTGANEFFYVTAADEASPKRNPSQARPPSPASLTAVEDASGAHHLIESKYLSAVVFSLKEISTITLRRQHTHKLFFNCARTPAQLTGTHALAYIRKGERAGFHLRPTCAAREHWYAAAAGRQPAPLLLPAKVGERWLVAINEASVFEDKKLYGIYPRPMMAKRLLAALLNSTWARYVAEVRCRQMTGAQAIADIDVKVAEEILIPDPHSLSPSMKKRLVAALTQLSKRPVLSVFEEVNRKDRRQLDELTLTAIGFRNRAERQQVLAQLYTAVTELVSARLAKADKRESGKRDKWVKG